MSEKIEWAGIITSIQPRTRVWRYMTDNRTHYHIGYNLFLKNEESTFSVAISEKQQEKLQFAIGYEVKGTAWRKKYEKREFADYYRAGALKVINKGQFSQKKSPPWTDSVPPMSVYEERGARMLAASKWRGKCHSCKWANKANIEIQWCFDKDIKKYRFETFCYGPKSCPNYDMGKPRAVPYRNRHGAEDEGFLDEIIAGHRDWDE